MEKLEIGLSIGLIGWATYLLISPLLFKSDEMPLCVDVQLDPTHYQSFGFFKDEKDFVEHIVLDPSTFLGNRNPQTNLSLIEKNRADFAEFILSPEFGVFQPCRCWDGGLQVLQIITSPALTHQNENKILDAIRLATQK